MQFPIVIGLHRSRILLCSLLLAGLVANILPFFYVSDRVVLALAVSVSSLVTFRARKLLFPRVKKLRLENSGQLSICEEEGSYLTAHCLPRATVHPWLTVFRVETEERRGLTVIVTIDSVAPSEFRQLRVFLRWRGDFIAERGIS